MELEINGITYKFKASMDFIDEIEKTRKYTTAAGEVIEYGLADAYVQMTSIQDVRALRDILYALNVGQTPRIRKSVLNEWLEEGCEDIGALADQVADFLSGQKLSAYRLQSVLKAQAKP